MHSCTTISLLHEAKSIYQGNLGFLKRSLILIICLVFAYSSNAQNIFDDEPEHAKIDGPMSVLINHSFGKLDFSLAYHPDQKSAISYDISANDSSLFFILNPTFERFRTSKIPSLLFEKRSGNFYFHFKYLNQTSTIQVEYSRDSLGNISLNPQIIEETGFIKLVDIKDLQADVTAWIQLHGNHKDTFMDVKGKLKGIAEVVVLEEGYYYGIPVKIETSGRKKNRHNKTELGYFLALEVKSMKDAIPLMEEYDIFFQNK